MESKSALLWSNLEVAELKVGVKQWLLIDREEEAENVSILPKLETTEMFASKMYVHDSCNLWAVAICPDARSSIQLSASAADFD